MLLQLLGVKVDAPYVNEIVSVVCGILMLLGVIKPAGESEVFGYPARELNEFGEEKATELEKKDEFTEA